MRGNEIRKNIGAVGGYRVGASGSKERAYEELAAAIIKQAASDDYLARQKLDDCKKWLKKNNRTLENQKRYRRYFNHVKRITGYMRKLLVVAYNTEDAYKSLFLLNIYCKYPDYDWMMKRKKWFARVITRIDAMIAAESTIRDVKQFFYSEWFVQLCDADGPMLYKHLIENYKIGRRPKGAD